MIKTGNLRIRKRDGSIFATTLGQIPEEPDFVIYCPFTTDSGMSNLLQNGYEINWTTDGTVNNNCYEGGLLCCDNIILDLTKQWLVQFEYVYTGSLTTTEPRSSTTLSNLWNHVFAWGTHIADGNPEKGVEWPRQALGIETGTDKKQPCELWCSVTDIKNWHYYSIKYENGTTSVSIDNEPQEIKQFEYSNKTEGFYLSGGGNYHSLPCKIKNLIIFATLTS